MQRSPVRSGPEGSVQEVIPDEELVIEKDPVKLRFMFNDGWVIDVTCPTNVYEVVELVRKHHDPSANGRS